MYFLDFSYLWNPPSFLLKPNDLSSTTDHGSREDLSKGKPYLFTIMIAVSAMSNFYFFYMLTIAAVIYALIRFPVYKESGFFKPLTFCRMVYSWSWYFNDYSFTCINRIF